jgi:hypothetical protein
MSPTKQIPMIIPRKEDLTGISGIDKASIRDTKKAVVFATSGLPIDPATGIYMVQKPGENWLDGDAYFPFKVSNEIFSRVNRIYDQGTADTELDAVLDQLKASSDPRIAETATKLEKLFIDALLVWGRRFLENHSRVLLFLRQKAPQIEFQEKKSGAFTFKFFGRNGQ